MPYYKDDNDQIFFFETEEEKEEFFPHLEAVTEKKALSIANPPLSLSEAKERHLRALKTEFQRRMDSIVASSQQEANTWSIQVEEAKAYKEDSSVDVPFITAMADARGITVDEAVDKILKKSQETSQKQATLLGEYQNLQDRVASATGKKQLDSIVFS